MTGELCLCSFITKWASTNILLLGQKYVRTLFGWCSLVSSIHRNILIAVLHAVLVSVNFCDKDYDEK